MNPKLKTQRQLNYRDYRLLSTLDEAAAKTLFDTIFDRSYEIQKTFKDSRATYAAQIRIGEESLVYKIPRARLRRFGEQLATLVRDCESIRTFKNLQLMNQLGFNAPIPLLAGEKRRRGFVADSFCCYRFEEGKAAETNDAQLVTFALLELHKKGYLRSDAKPANFLISEKGVTFIDFRLKKPTLFPKFKIEMELAHFARIYPESMEFIPKKIRTSFSFALAGWMERKSIELRQARRRLKRSSVSRKS